MTQPATQPASHRLRTQRDFRSVYGRGRRASGEWLTVVVWPRRAGEVLAARVGVSHLGTAVGTRGRFGPGDGVPLEAFVEWWWEAPQALHSGLGTKRDAFLAPQLCAGGGPVA